MSLKWQEHTMRLALAIGAALWTALPGYAAAPGDSAAGKKLHDAHCMSCHNTSVYTRKDRQIKSLSALGEQLNECTHAAQVTLTDADQQNVIKYLNEQFYKFK
jgi:mono/diheme cytochrome c family protein